MGLTIFEYNPYTKSFKNYQSLLLNDFFNSDELKRDLILKEYEILFGKSCFEYLKKKYYNHWREGGRNISNVQTKRILEIMPNFLSVEVKQLMDEVKEKAIYDCGLLQLNKVINFTLNNFTEDQNTQHRRLAYIYSNQLQLIYDNDYQRISFDLVKEYVLSFLKFRVNLLTIEEINGAAIISHFILKSKLTQTFSHIKNDINQYSKLVFRYKKNCHNVEYTCYDFHWCLDLMSTDLFNLSIKEPENVSFPIGRFSESINHFLINRLLEMEKFSKNAQLSSVLNTADLNLLFDFLKSTKTKHLQIKSISKFNCEGGVLEITTKVEPLSGLILSIIYSVFKIISALSLFSSVIFFLWRVEKELVPLFFIVVIIFLWGFIYDEIGKLKKFKKELKIYGK